MNHPAWTTTLYQYPDDQLCAVTFPSDSELMHALERMWDRHHPLFGVPRDIAAERTMILPAAAVPHLKGIRCWKGSVIAQAESPAVRTRRPAAVRD